MNTAVSPQDIEHLLTGIRRIRYLEWGGMFLFFVGLLLWKDTILSLGFLIGGVMGITRGSDLRRWNKKLRSLLRE